MSAVMTRQRGPIHFGVGAHLCNDLDLHSMAAASDVLRSVLVFRDPEVEEALRRVHRRHDHDKGSDAFLGVVKEAVLAAVRAGEPGCLVTIGAYDDEFGCSTGSTLGQWALAFAEQNRGMKDVRLSGPDGPLVRSKLGKWMDGLDSETELRLWFSW